MRLALLALFALALRAQPVTILTYNIHHGEGLDARIDIPRIAAIIRAANPDFAAIQEVDVRTARVHSADLAHQLAAATGLHVVFGKTIPHQGGLYGNAILSRLPLNGFSNIPFPHSPNREPRALLSAQTHAGFSFLATHLDIAQPDRLQAVAALAQLLKDENAPMILAGDLNATPDSPVLAQLLNHWSNATLDQPLLTSPAEAPKRQIDYILFRPARRWRILSVQVLAEPVASDHRPLLATLELLPD